MFPVAGKKDTWYVLLSSVLCCLPMTSDNRNWDLCIYISVKSLLRNYRLLPEMFITVLLHCTALRPLPFYQVILHSISSIYLWKLLVICVFFFCKITAQYFRTLNSCLPTPGCPWAMPRKHHHHNVQDSIKTTTPTTHRIVYL